MKHLVLLAGLLATVPAVAQQPPASVQEPPASQQPPAAAPAKNVDEAVERAGAYVAAYGEQMAPVIGVERYAQWMQRADAPRPTSKHLVSEFALVRVKDDWLGFRDVYEIDGQAAGDRQDRIQKLFLESQGNSLEQGRRISDESARHNLGPLQRNFNVPTTALLFLQPSNVKRFSFKKTGEDKVNDVRVWKIGYQETSKPTLIRTGSGVDMPVKGTFWVDPLTGRVLKTHMELKLERKGTAKGSSSSDPGGFGDLLAQAQKSQSGIDDRRVVSSVSITVTYRQEAALAMLVPGEMRETYEAPMRSAFSGEELMTTVNCRATYEQFRRFDTSGKLIVK